jgi:hypothetical protein
MTVSLGKTQQGSSRLRVALLWCLWHERTGTWPIALGASVRTATGGQLVRIQARHRTVGVVLGERAAPIVGYMTYWTLERIRDYCRARGWICQSIEQ